MSRLQLGEKFSLIYIAFSSLEEIVEDDARLLTLIGIRDHILPGGRAVITLHNPGTNPDSGRPGTERRIERLFTDEISGRQFRFRHLARLNGEVMEGTQAFEYLDTGETIGPIPVRYRPTLRAEFAALVEESGLNLEALYGDYQRSPFDESRSPRMIWELGDARRRRVSRSSPEETQRPPPVQSPPA